jgi:hypothetical protein
LVEEPDGHEAEDEGARPRPVPDVLMQNVDDEEDQDEQQFSHQQKFQRGKVLYLGRARHYHAPGPFSAKDYAAFARRPM